jgi:hypothetical protein
VSFEKPVSDRSYLGEPLLRLLTLGLLFVAALCLRLYGITQPPMDFFQTRQYHGALLARGFYEWLLTGNLRTIPPDGIIEPPILELVASFAYLIFGGEHLWIPRLLSALFWMVGGVFLYWVAKKIVSPNAAVFSVAFYLFVPYGVLASRAFMPDPLMIMLLVISIFTILRYHEQPSTRRLIVAAVVSSLAIFVKPGICFFQVFGAFVSLAVCRQGIRRSLASRHLLMFVPLSILPTVLYYLYGTILAKFLHGQASRKIVPQLILQPSFWDGWLLALWLVVGYVALVGAMFGVVLLRKGFPMALMIGLWSGYFLFGLTFTVHIHTHSYYSLQLIPVVALSLGSVSALVMKYLGQVGLRSLGGVIVLGLSVSVLTLGVAEQRYWIGQIANQKRFAPVYESYVATFQEIGEVVDHSPRTLVLFESLPYVESGYALMYHGRLLGQMWPSPVQTVQHSGREREISTRERFDKYSKKYSPEYFIISKRSLRTREARDLRRFLTENFSTVAQDPIYVVFDLREET